MTCPGRCLCRACCPNKCGSFQTRQREGRTDQTNETLDCKPRWRQRGGRLVPPGLGITARNSPLHSFHAKGLPGTQAGVVGALGLPFDPLTSGCGPFNKHPILSAHDQIRTIPSEEIFRSLLGQAGGERGFVACDPPSAPRRAVKGQHAVEWPKAVVRSERRQSRPGRSLLFNSRINTFVFPPRSTLVANQN
jgi:hypothetical protein